MTKQTSAKLKKLAKVGNALYQLSDRAGAALANAVMTDLGLINENYKTNVIDQNKLRQERKRCWEELRKEEDANFDLVNGIYLDSRKDGTMVITQSDEGKKYRKTVLEEQYVIVDKPGEFYLTYVTTEDGRGRTIARCIYSVIKTTDLEDKLAIIGSDGTATMTGPYNGAIRCLEELLGRPLQWAVCLLHCNELPLRHIFITIDGKTESPETFCGKIGKELSGCMSEWPIADFKAISNPHFPLLPNEVVDDLSADSALCLQDMLGCDFGWPWCRPGVTGSGTNLPCKMADISL